MEEKERKKKEEEEAKQQRRKEREEKGYEGKKRRKKRRKSERENRWRERKRQEREEIKKKKAEAREAKRRRKAELKSANKENKSRRTIKGGLQEAEISSSECATCFGLYEDDFIDGQLVQEWIQCTDPDCGKWMHLDTDSKGEISLVPRPFEEEEKGPGTHCVRMR